MALYIFFFNILQFSPSCVFQYLNIVQYQIYSGTKITQGLWKTKAKKQIGGKEDQRALIFCGERTGHSNSGADSEFIVTARCEVQRKGLALIWRDQKRFLKEVVWWAKFKEWPQWSSPFYNFILFEYGQNLWICWDIIPAIMLLSLAKRSLSKWAQSHHMNLLEEENLNMRVTWDSREAFCSWAGGGHVNRAESNL